MPRIMADTQAGGQQSKGSAVTDNRINRVKVMLGGSSSDGDSTEHPMIQPHRQSQQTQPPHQPQPPNQALQVLTMAQRTAEEHVQSARAQADKIRTDALAAAEQMARDAEQHAHQMRREADKVLFEARSRAEQMAREAQAHADEGRRTVQKIEADGRAHAEAIAADAEKDAEDLRVQAQRRYDDVVGSLSSKRTALQSQIEALEAFDQQYRARLTTFMQGQMRALWVDQPQVTGELEHPGSHAFAEIEATSRAMPQQRQSSEPVTAEEYAEPESELSDR
jgi:cell division septum initiation protein DivIVA